MTTLTGFEYLTTIPGAAEFMLGAISSKSEWRRRKMYVLRANGGGTDADNVWRHVVSTSFLTHTIGIQDYMSDAEDEDQWQRRKARVRQANGDRFRYMWFSSITAPGVALRVHREWLAA